ncbi:MAG: molybdenum cofactor carrier protein [Nitrospinales bacterium]
MKKKRIIIGVIGSATASHPHLSIPLGRWLAEQGYNLVNGGGPGVMEAVAKAFCEVKERTGIVIGILPSRYACESPEQRRDHQPQEGYPNAYVDIPIYTHLHLSGSQGKETDSRNHIIVLTANTVIAFPGNAGTRSEIELALEYRKPLIIVNPAGEWDEFKNSAAMVKNIEEMIDGIRRLETGGGRG